MNRARRDDETGHAALGALIRTRRSDLGLSMDDLARRANVGRSTLYRIEHGLPIQPTPSKLARLLAVLGIGEAAAKAVLPDDEWGQDVIHWLDRAHTIAEVQGYIDARRPSAAGVDKPDLVLLHQDGTVVVLQVKHATEQDPAVYLDGLAAAARSAGYMVTVPAE